MESQITTLLPRVLPGTTWQSAGAEEVHTVRLFACVPIFFAGFLRMEDQRLIGISPPAGQHHMEKIWSWKRYGILKTWKMES